MIKKKNTLNISTIFFLYNFLRYLALFRLHKSTLSLRFPAELLIELIDGKTGGEIDRDRLSVQSAKNRPQKGIGILINRIDSRSFA